MAAQSTRPAETVRKVAEQGLNDAVEITLLIVRRLRSDLSGDRSRLRAADPARPVRQPGGAIATGGAGQCRAAQRSGATWTKTWWSNCNWRVSQFLRSQIRYSRHCRFWQLCRSSSRLPL